MYAVAAGVGYSADAHHIAQPDPDGTGVILAIRRVLADAGLSPEQVVHVNAHATSTPAGDVVECEAIATALGGAAPGVVVSATKSMTGHLLGGAGAVESVAAILALRERVAPPTINLEDPDHDAGVRHRHRSDEAAAAGLRPHGRAEQLVRLRRAQCRPSLHRPLIRVP